LFTIRDTVIVLLTRLERAVQDLANSHAGLVAALVVGAVLALVVVSCCWAVQKCLGRPKKRAMRRPLPGGEARGAVALDMEPIVAAAVPALPPAPAPVVAVAVPAPPPAPAPVVAVAPGEVAERINEAVGALDPDELQAVIAALRAVPRGGPPIPPPMNMRLPSLGHPPYVGGGFSG